THSIPAAVLLQSTPHPSPLPEERELVATKTPPSKPTGRAPETSAGFDGEYSHTGGVVVHVVAAQQRCQPGVKVGTEGVEGRCLLRATPRVGDRQSRNGR